MATNIEKLSPRGEFSENEHDCLAKNCPACDKPLLFVIQPDYDLEVGIRGCLPQELCFLAEGAEAITEKGQVPFWGRHKLASEYFLEIRCPCGEKSQTQIGKDEGLMLMTSKKFCDETSRSVPKAKLQYKREPLGGWVVEG